ncbi:hypothetical protein CLV81_0082 [Flagellimonas meridianipacifica]|uniref:Uncharacterized protein n=1 Tax=Flagellimonas meridianipacifica TaxID=1080225 RepID=A0A2T0MET9_9FLAO|nr:hypothetical protein CLV81_0082 [Allomuricauda pacifica]
MMLLTNPGGFQTLEEITINYMKSAQTFLTEFLPTVR